jgi:N-acetylglucosaminyldiphosphoundecaprenol N-acetyl-beta-D-mannosaminyltransferase
MSKPGRINLLGVIISLATIEDVLGLIDESLASQKKTVIAHVHVRALNLAYEQPWFRQFLNNASLVYCDGMGVRLGSWIVGYHDLPQRYTLADWIWRLAQHAVRRGYSLFFLGNPPGSAEKAARNLQEIFPNLRVTGSYHGFFDKTHESPENRSVLDQIEAAKPDILLVGFGMPDQERWIGENWGEIKAGFVIPCGAVFEYIAGDLKRGPRWMTDHYLEWLARLFISPQRYWQRYLRDNPVFIWRVLKQKIFRTVPAE